VSERPALSPTKRRALWKAFAELYGHKWTSSYGDNPDAGAAVTWGKVLGDITAQQLADGLSACAKSADPWPPTLPQFRGMCLSVPELHDVRRELVAQLSHGGPAPTGFARLVSQNLDYHRWRFCDADKADRLLREAYLAARDHVMRGGSLPEPPAGAIAHEEPAPAKPASPEVAAEALRKLQDVLAGESYEE
jgi:hypothetical protein